MNRFALAVGSLSLSALLIGYLAGCVDVPSTGPAPPDYRSFVRYFHAGFGIDTVAIYNSSSTSTDTSQTQVMIGTDTVRTTTARLFKNASYTRLQVNYASDFTVIVDGATIASVSFGTGTGYFNTASGIRSVKLSATANFVDDVTIADTTINTAADTIGTNGTVRSGTGSVTNLGTFQVAHTGQTVAVVDSAVAGVNTQTQFKATLYLISDSTANYWPAADNRGGLLRYGKIRYLYGIERYTFDPGVARDSSKVLFANGSRIFGGAVDISHGSTVDVSNLGFALSSRYRIYPAPSGMVYTFYVAPTGTVSPIDSVQVPVVASENFTAVFFDSASTVTSRVLRND